MYSLNFRCLYFVSARSVLKGHTANIEDVVFEPESDSKLASVGDDHAMLIWDTSAGFKPVQRVGNLQDAIKVDDLASHSCAFMCTSIHYHQLLHMNSMCDKAVFVLSCLPTSILSNAIFLYRYYYCSGIL